MTTPQSDMSTVLVTGATGKTGAAVIHALRSRGVAVRGLTRSGSGRAPDADPGLTWVSGDLTDPASLVPALDGVDAVHLIVPNMASEEVAMTEAVLQAAREAGVRRIVHHSVMHPYEPEMPHHVRKAEAEHLVRTSGMDWTVIQPAAYHQNLLPQVAASRSASGTPAGTAVLSVPYSLDVGFTNVDLLDVAEVTAAALTEDGHRFATWQLAGPEALSVNDLAAQASDVLGVPIEAREVAPPENAPDDLIAMFSHYDAHGFCGHPATLAMLLGREPTSWRDAVAREIPQQRSAE